MREWNFTFFVKEKPELKKGRIRGGQCKKPGRRTKRSKLYLRNKRWAAKLRCQREDMEAPIIEARGLDLDALSSGSRHIFFWLWESHFLWYGSSLGLQTQSLAAVAGYFLLN